MTTRARSEIDDRFEALERAAARAGQQRDAVMLAALRWFAARERGDGKVIAAMERESPALARRLRGVEDEMSLPKSPIERARTYRRLHDALLVMRLSDALGDLIAAMCPLCGESSEHEEHDDIEVVRVQSVPASLG